MANLVRLIGLACTLAVVTGCGTNQLQGDLNEEKNESLEKQLETDEAAFALSVPIARESAEGAIVVEKSVSLPLAYANLIQISPPPPEATCLVRAGAHLRNVQASEEFEFTAQVKYPLALQKNVLLKNSCKDGETVIVRAGSGLQGLAVTKKKTGTKFTKMLNPKPLSTATVTQCTVHAGRQNIKIDASDSYGRILGKTVAAQAVMNRIHIMGECGFGDQLLVDSKSLQGVLEGEKIIPIPLPGATVSVTSSK